MRWDILFFSSNDFWTHTHTYTYTLMSRQITCTSRDLVNDVREITVTTVFLNQVYRRVEFNFLKWALLWVRGLEPGSWFEIQVRH